jgi:hypothetical protein
MTEDRLAEVFLGLLLLLFGSARCLALARKAWSDAADMDCLEMRRFAFFLVAIGVAMSVVAFALIFGRAPWSS